MKRSKFSDEQIVGVLKEHEAGAKTADLSHRHGIGEATFYNGKSLCLHKTPNGHESMEFWRRSHTVIGMLALLSALGSCSRSGFVVASRWSSSSSPCDIG